MSWDYIRRTYRVPAEMLGRVRYTGGRKAKLGTIEGTHGGRLLIRLDGEDRAGRYHPTWELEYLPAQVGTHPQGGDAKQAPGESLSDAVHEVDAPK